MSATRSVLKRTDPVPIEECSNTHSSGVISKEVDEGRACAELLLPCLGGESVVDGCAQATKKKVKKKWEDDASISMSLDIAGTPAFLSKRGRERLTNDVDTLDALGRELVGLLDVTGDLARARWCERARDTDNDDLAREVVEVDVLDLGVALLELGTGAELVTDLERALGSGALDLVEKRHCARES